MKKITSVLLLAIICFGCGQAEKKAPLQQAKQSAHARNNAPLFQYGNTALLQYDRYLAGLDTQLVDMSHQAIDTFKLLFKDQPAAVCDTAFYVFNQFHSLMCAYLNERMGEDSIDYMDFISMDEKGKPMPLSKKHKAIKNRLERNGFGLDSEEGGVFIEQNQHFLAEQFAAYVSDPLKQYLVQLDKEQQEGFEADAGLTITPTVFADRTVWWENFTKANATNFIYAREAARSYNLLLFNLLLGMDNTPVRAGINENLGQDSLSDYFREAYTYLQVKHPQTATNSVVAPYFSAWQKRDTTTISQVMKAYEEKYRSFFD